MVRGHNGVSTHACRRPLVLAFQNFSTDRPHLCVSSIGPLLLCQKGLGFNHQPHQPPQTLACPFSPHTMNPAPPQEPPVDFSHPDDHTVHSCTRHTELQSSPCSGCAQNPQHPQQQMHHRKAISKKPCLFRAGQRRYVLAAPDATKSPPPNKNKHPLSLPKSSTIAIPCRL